jgi:hypothetical protein
MAGRICIPVHDADGNLVAYAGRYASDDVPRDVERYKVPPNFQKRRRGAAANFPRLATRCTFTDPTERGYIIGSTLTL